MTAPRYLEAREITPEMCAPAVDPGCCTGVIAAAGRGSRLGSGQPKILYPVAGVSMLQRLVDLLAPVCARYVLVVSPGGRRAITEAAERICPGKFDIAEQLEPTGMLDAVLCGMELVKTPHTAIVWGDQAGLRSESVRTCLALHYGPFQPDATIPTLMCDRPYIHFERDEAGTIVGVLQEREGDRMPARGESDCGFFILRTELLGKCLAQADASVGRITGERNFLPVLALIAAPATVLSVRIATPMEALGVNTREDAEILSSYLMRASGGGT